MIIRFNPYRLDFADLCRFDTTLDRRDLTTEEQRQLVTEALALFAENEEWAAEKVRLEKEIEEIEDFWDNESELHAFRGDN